jgi:hypothetical protein
MKNFISPCFLMVSIIHLIQLKVPFANAWFISMINKHTQTNPYTRRVGHSYNKSSFEIKLRKHLFQEHLTLRV